MSYTLEQLCEDVLSRMGEQYTTDSGVGIAGSPTIAEAVERKIKSLLPEAGRRLLLDAHPGQLGGAEAITSSVTTRRMPCGEYAAEISLPDDFVRLVSVKMTGWKRPVYEVVGPESDFHARQWSEEAGIAGCPERPQVYLLHKGSGLALCAMSSPTSTETPEHLLIWRQPAVAADGSFRFPAALYPTLVGTLTATLHDSN